jgi:hypothetical protein
MDALELFIETTNTRLEKIESKLDQLISFRWLLIGAGVSIGGLVSFITTIIINYKIGGL